MGSDEEHDRYVSEYVINLVGSLAAWDKETKHIETTLSFLETDFEKPYGRCLCEEVTPLSQSN